MQTQTVLGDIKSQELLALLRRDRSSEKTTTRQQIAYRMQAESVLGTDENLYKVEFVSSIAEVYPLKLSDSGHDVECS